MLGGSIDVSSSLPATPLLPSDGAETTHDESRRAALLRQLLAEGREVAPHVLDVLLRRLGDDPRTIVETATELSPAQRHGRRALPAVLPLVPAIAEAFSVIEIADDDRAVLLTAAVASEDSVDTLKRSCGCSARRLADPPLAAHLLFERGRFTFADPRLRIWVQETATPLERQEAHERCARGSSLALAGHRAWHRARAALDRAPETVPLLGEASTRLRALVRWEEAFRCAEEAVHHASPELREDALLLAGRTALGAGWIEDAADFFGEAVRTAGESGRGRALPGFLLATTLVRGTPPLSDPAPHRPDSEDVESWGHWTVVAALSAVLHAVRGRRAPMRIWLTEVREASRRSGVHTGICGAAVALCWLLSGEDEDIDLLAPDAVVCAVVAPLREALGGDVDAGLEILSRFSAAISEASEPRTGEVDPSPLLDAYRALIEVLLLVWRGDVGRARDRLLDAARALPLAVPFAGLGVILARRLDILVLGAQGETAQALTAALPAGARIDAFVDRGVEAYLAGDMEDALLSLQLWADRGAPEPPLSVPGLDEIGPFVPRDARRPPDVRHAEDLRHRIRRLPQNAWNHDYPALVAEARALRSPFSRGRVEGLLGTGCAIHGDARAARRHLQVAQSLFADAGASAWEAAIAARLERIERLAASGADAFAACRAAWDPVLTERELEVALLVVDGAVNREIAERLGVSVRTVEVHIGRIFAKLSLRGRVELTALAHRTNQIL